MRSKKRYKKNAWSTEKSEWPGQNELSLASWHLIGWEDGEKFLDQSRSEERWDPHYFRPYSGIALQSIRRDSIHNLLPHCNVISLRYSDETYFPEYNVKMSSGLVASGPTAFSAMQNTAWRFSVKPCVRIINWIIIFMNFQTLYIAVGKLWHLGIWYSTGASRRKLTDG